MSIVVATLVAAIAAVTIRNLLGYLNSGSEGFDVRKSIASGVTAFMLGVPLIGVAFESAFADVQSLSDIAQLLLFFVQVIGVAGIDGTVKSGLKARAKGVQVQ